MSDSAFLKIKLSKLENEKEIICNQNHRKKLSHTLEVHHEDHIDRLIQGKLHHFTSDGHCEVHGTILDESDEDNRKRRNGSAMSKNAVFAL